MTRTHFRLFSYPAFVFDTQVARCVPRLCRILRMRHNPVGSSDVHTICQHLAHIHVRQPPAHRSMACCSMPVKIYIPLATRVRHENPLPPPPPALQNGYEHSVHHHLSLVIFITPTFHQYSNAPGSACQQQINIGPWILAPSFPSLLLHCTVVLAPFFASQEKGGYLYILSREKRTLFSLMT